MKVITAIILSAMLLIAHCNAAALGLEYKVYTSVHGGGENIVVSPVAPYIENGRTFLPIHFLADAFGIFMTLDETGKTVVLEREKTTAQFTVGSRFLWINKNGVRNSLEMDAVPVIKNGVICVPIRFIAETFGCEMELWDESYREGISDYIQVVVNNGRKISEGGRKMLELKIGNEEVVLAWGYFMTFYDGDNFRFAYPRYQFVDYAEWLDSNIEPRQNLTVDSDGRRIVVEHLSNNHTPDLILTATYEPVKGTSFEDMELHSAIKHIETRLGAAVEYEFIAVSDIPAVAYRLPPTQWRPITVSGAALFHQGNLFCFEITIQTNLSFEQYEELLEQYAEDAEIDVERRVLSEIAAFTRTAKSNLDELLPTVRMK